MNEEEKKAIEYIKEFKNEVFEGVGNKSIMAKNIDILLNLIDKQQKEIVELKTKLEVEKIDNKYNQEERDEETIPRYKIREKLNYFEHSFDYDDDGTSYELVMEVLEELLEENNDGDHIPRID